MKERLKEFLNNQQLNARQFADKIGVQPSSISHILTGRNKPSIELLDKMILAFPDIDIQYLISGIEKSEIQGSVSDIPDEDAGSMNDTDTQLPYSEEDTKVSDVERVMVFHSDGTFSEYLPR